MAVFLCVNHFGEAVPVLVRAGRVGCARRRAERYTGVYAGWNCFRATHTGMPRDKDVVVVNGRLEGARVRLPPWQLFTDATVKQALSELGVRITR